MSNDQERREYKRIEKPFMARLRIKQYEGLEISSAEWGIVALKDLSAGGALFYYIKYLGLGSLLDLKIYVPNSVLIINCVGKVTRIEQFKPTSVFTIAIKFIDIGEQEKEMINTTVEEFLEYKIKIFELSNEIRTTRSRLLMYNDLERRKYKRVDTHGL